MPTDLESGILSILRARAGDDRPVTFNDLARRFGATAPMVASIGRQLVEKGLATPSYVINRGVETLYALLPPPAEKPAGSDAAPPPVAAE
jgi:DNA-binding Lrp family transcriptional regulator